MWKEVTLCLDNGIGESVQRFRDTEPDLAFPDGPRRPSSDGLRDALASDPVVQHGVAIITEALRAEIGGAGVILPLRYRLHAANLLTIDAIGRPSQAPR
jgi:hypothetical protein